MAIELWANNAQSTLASGITNSDLSLTVASGHGARFPSPGSDYFYVTLDDGANIEIVKCTARSTDTLTIVRAQQGTSAASFSTGTAVELRLTKGSLETLRDGGAPTSADYWVETANASLSAEVVVGTTGITTAAYASRQAAAKAGRLFLPNNGCVLERDSGSAWLPWGPLFPFTAPVDGDYSWFNQGGASVSTTNGGISLSIPSSATTNFRGRSKTKTAPYTITAAVLLNFIPANYVRSFGLFFTDGTKVHGFGIAFDSAAAGVYQIASTKWTDATNISANYSIIAYQTFSPVLWLRIADNSSNRICSISADGVDFIPYHTVGRTDFLTATSVGFGGDILNSNAAYMRLLSWTETA